jgi:hypothetical protein
MMSPTNRVVAALYTVVVLGIFAVAYFGMSPQFEFALRMCILTASILIIVYGFFRRNLSAILVGAGLFVEAYDMTNRFFLYAGMALALGGFGLLWWKHRETPPRSTVG